MLCSAKTKSSSVNSSPNLAKSNVPILSLFPIIGTIVDILLDISQLPSPLKTQIPLLFTFAKVSVIFNKLSLYPFGNLHSSKTYFFIIPHSKSLENVCPKTFPFLLIIYTLQDNTSLKSLHISSNTTGSAPPVCRILFNLLVLFNNDDN